MRTRILTIAALSLLAPLTPALTGPAAAVPAGAASAPRYTITDLGTLGGDRSAATAISNSGQVVGYSVTPQGAEHAFRWSAGSMTDLGTLPGGGYSHANAVNDAGQVAGLSDRSSGSYGYPVRWSAAGAIQDLGGPITNQLGSGNAIDPAGRVAGGQRPASSEGEPVAMLYDTAGRPHLLAKGSLGAAAGINARGQIVGSPAYIWQNGAVTSLPGLAGGSASARAISISGLVAGSAGTVDGSLHAALWRGRAITDLGTIDGIRYNQANAVNAAGQVVGTADPLCSPCVAPRAWLWRAGSATALDSLIPAGSGWTLQQANGISDRGEIAGAGLHNGKLHAFVLTPVFHATVDFGPAATPAAPGYSADTGAVYGPRGGGLTYGWDVSNTASTRIRHSAASPDARYDTLTHLQKPGAGTRWELAVPSGQYLVHIVAGDPVATDSTFRISAEGALAVAATPTAASPWAEGTVRVNVTDGRLTIANAPGSSNDKLCYLDVTAV
jgi:probable HAF family extracellular repeat protein